MKQLYSKKHMIGWALGLPLALLLIGGCGGDEPTDPAKTPADLVKELAGSYTVDYTITPTPDVTLQGFSTPSTTGKGDLTVAAASDNASEAELTIAAGTVPVLKQGDKTIISVTNLVLKARVFDIKENNGVTTYTVKSASIKGDNLGGTEYALANIATVGSPRATSHSYEGTLSFTTAVLAAVISDATVRLAITAALQKQNKSALGVKFRVAASNATKK